MSLARIVLVYEPSRRRLAPRDMSTIRWLAMARALARRGHSVDVAADEPGLRGRMPRGLGDGVRRLPLSRVDWDRYDVVKTLFHRGFETLEARGGAGHPFVISKLGSVVDDRDRPGIYFEGEVRRRLFAAQERIARAARFVTVLTAPSAETWRAQFGETPPLLLVPGAADAEVPPPRPADPYGARDGFRCLFAGNVYDAASQPSAHARIVATLNAVGRALAKSGGRLHVLAAGDVRAIDRAAVAVHAPVPYAESWEWMRRADVGFVPALGDHPNENESTKIYHHLRIGLPSVVEDGFPNQGLIAEAGLGIVAPNGDPAGIAEAVAEAARRPWDRAAGPALVLAAHTWDHRARAYDAVLP